MNGRRTDNIHTNTTITPSVTHEAPATKSNLYRPAAPNGRSVLKANTHFSFFAGAFLYEPFPMHGLCNDIKRAIEQALFFFLIP